MTRRRFLASSLLTAVWTALPARSALPASTVTGTPWRNWSGALRCNPASRLAPATEDELLAILSRTTGPIRPVGAGHSFSALVPTDGHLLVLDRMNGLASHDPEAMTAELWAGTRLSDAGPMLDGIGQAMFNLPDIDRQTLAGAIATSTHGTGKHLKSLSGYIASLRLVTPAGEILDLDRDHNGDVFQAARVSLGALGVVTRVGFHNRTPFRLRNETWVQETASVIESFEQLSGEYEHFELMPLLHSDHSLVIAHRETTDPVEPPPDEEDDGAFLALIDATPVPLRGALIGSLAAEIEPTSSVSTSWRGLTNLRFDRFNEMEYSIPADAGPDCLREILETVERESVDVTIPLEYRIIDADDAWLSMFEGAPRVSISVHRMARYDYRPLFELVEPIFWKYEGRPHWGKLHTLGYAELARLYPRLPDFVEVRRSLDPDGRLLNPHLRYLLTPNAAA